ncbi:MAG: PAS domain-containing protein [Campylobacterales bacterium]|nr:PAS domain-containing protein [Campylobacterales bacterium]HEO97868.1 PAS domain S-box protein [Campylobacterota bacterium]
MERPPPKNEQITLDPKRYIVSKTDPKGVITYGNDYFVEISGYKEAELIAKPHNLIRHPDMPQVVFKVMWDRIRKGQSIMAVVKNMAKDGRYYWVITDFESKKDKLTNEITGYTAFRKAAPKDVVKTVEPLYQKLLEIEAQSGMEGAEKYLVGFLEEKGLSYDEFIDQIVGNKGLFKVFFTAMKKLFG